ncbi:MAG: hypothetical protein JSR18_14895 [Proteobacteria bacterium]|nr:hypothetical protein [Pseudomonadota bacterium]
MGPIERATGLVALALIAGCATPAANPNEGPGAAMAQKAAATAPTTASAAPMAPREVANARALIANPGFEAPVSGGDFEAWTTAQHAGVHSYDFDLDTAIHYAGKHSMRITNVGPEPYGAFYQVLPAQSYRGKTLEFSGYIRTVNATGGGAQLTLLARSSGAILAHAFLDDPGVVGTHDWQRYSVRLKIPKDAQRVEVGGMLVGPGTAWFDTVMLSEVTAER